MKSEYETLDEYLDELDKIKERIADETEGLSPEQVKDYFAQARKQLKKVGGRQVRLRKRGHKDSVVHR